MKGHGLLEERGRGVGCKTDRLGKQFGVESNIEDRSPPGRTYEGAGDVS